MFPRVSKVPPTAFAIGGEGETHEVILEVDTALRRHGATQGSIGLEVRLGDHDGLLLDLDFLGVVVSGISILGTSYSSSSSARRDRRTACGGRAVIGHGGGDCCWWWCC